MKLMKDVLKIKRPGLLRLGLLFATVFASHTFPMIQSEEDKRISATLRSRRAKGKQQLLDESTLQHNQDVLKQDWQEIDEMLAENEMREAWKNQDKAFLDSIKKNVTFKKLEQQLQQDEIAKGWFKGPSLVWRDQIISLAFKLLEPYKNRSKYAHNFDVLYSSILSKMRRAIIEYDKKCYFHIYDINALCSEIATQLDNLIQSSR